MVVVVVVFAVGGEARERVRAGVFPVHDARFVAFPAVGLWVVRHAFFVWLRVLAEG